MKWAFDEVVRMGARFVLACRPHLSNSAEHGLGGKRLASPIDTSHVCDGSYIGVVCGQIQQQTPLHRRSIS